MDAFVETHDAAVQMIDTSVVRVHQHGACIAGNSEHHMARSRGGLTTKIYVAVSLPDTTGSQPTILLPSSLHLYGFGYVHMSPRPNQI